MNWRAQPLDFMSLTQLAMIADDPHDSRRDEARQRVYRAMARNERLPPADPAPVTNYEHATYGDG